MLSSIAVLLLCSVFLSPCCNCEESQSNSIKKIAILPLRNISSGVVDEKEIRVELADVLKSKKNIEVLSFDYSDKLLEEKGLLSNKKFKITELPNIGKSLDVDGILLGNITTYHVPSEGERAAGSFIPLTEAVVKIEAKLRFYECQSDKIIWERLIIGYSKLAVLKIESFGINMKAAIGRFKEDFDYRWLRNK